MTLTRFYSGWKVMPEHDNKLKQWFRSHMYPRGIAVRQMIEIGPYFKFYFLKKRHYVNLTRFRVPIVNALMTEKEKYNARGNLKRWLDELEVWKDELEERLEGKHQHDKGSVTYCLDRVDDIESQIHRIRRLDIRTKEQKGGVIRKKYKRVKKIEDRGMSKADLRNQRRRATYRKVYLTEEEYEEHSFEFDSWNYDEHMKAAHKKLHNGLAWGDPRGFQYKYRYKRTDVGAYVTDSGRDLIAKFLNEKVPKVNEKHAEECGRKAFWSTDKTWKLIDEWLLEYHDDVKRVRSTSVRTEMKEARRRLKSAKAAAEGSDSFLPWPKAKWKYQPFRQGDYRTGLSSFNPIPVEEAEAEVAALETEQAEATTKRVRDRLSVKCLRWLLAGKLPADNTELPFAFDDAVRALEGIPWKLRKKLKKHVRYIEPGQPHPVTGAISDKVQAVYDDVGTELVLEDEPTRILLQITARYPQWSTDEVNLAAPDWSDVEAAIAYWEECL